MREPYDPHRDPAPDPSDHRLIRGGLLVVVGLIFGYAMVAGVCDMVGPGGSGRMCSPGQTWDWMTQAGGWWKFPLAMAVFSGLAWVAGVFDKTA